MSENARDVLLASLKKSLSETMNPASVEDWNVYEKVAAAIVDLQLAAVDAAGLTMVPKEPTDEMVLASFKAMRSSKAEMKAIERHSLATRGTPHEIGAIAGLRAAIAAAARARKP